jgi:hypothetical protein
MAFFWIALILPVSASPVVSPEDAETMRLEALADRAPERIHGRFDFLPEDPDMAVDATTGQATSSDDDCWRVPVKVTAERLRASMFVTRATRRVALPLGAAAGAWFP